MIHPQGKLLKHISFLVSHFLATRIVDFHNRGAPTVLNFSFLIRLVLSIKASEMLVAPRISECFGLGLL